MKQPVIVEEAYAASRDAVWQALTNPVQMKQWYFDIPGFTPEPGYQFQFDAGDDKKTFTHYCRVTDAIPGQKIAYTWKYDFDPADTFVSFELSDKEGGTNVKITHEGLDDFNPANEDLKKENFVKGWTGFLKTNLKKFLEKQQA